MKLPLTVQIRLKAPALSRDVVVDLPVLHANSPAFVAAHAAPDLELAIGGSGPVSGRLLLVPQPSTKDGQRRGFVSELGTFGLATYHQLRWFMYQCDSGFGTIDALSSWARCATNRPFQILFAYDEGGLDWFGHHSDRDCAGMHASALFSWRNTLPAMAARFINKCRSCVVAGYLEGDGAGSLVDYFCVKDSAARSDVDRFWLGRVLSPWHHRRLLRPVFQ